MNKNIDSNFDDFLREEGHLDESETIAIERVSAYKAKLTSQKNLKTLKVVIGLGKTGISCVKYLLREGFIVGVIDSRAEPPCLNELQLLQHDYPGILLHLGNFAADFLSIADEIIVSPGVSLKQPEIAAQIARGVKAIGDIELFAREANAPIVAITGSNGKSTVTTLVGLMAEKAGVNVRVGGNLGTPVLELLDDKAELYVLEISSFQLETTHSLHASAAVILNVTPDHMDRYSDFTEYLAAKQLIYKGCKIAVINRNDQTSFAGAPLPERIISFGLNKPDEISFGLLDNYLCRGTEKLLAIDQLKIKGMHQVANALAALALGSAINLPMRAMVQALIEFPGLPHRCQYITTIAGIAWYNDSKGTNVGAAYAAIEGLGAAIEGKIILIAGGLGKDADFSTLREPVTKYVRTLVLFGKDAPIIEKVLQGTCKIVNAQSMQEAVMLSKMEAQPGDAVLLSPACASYDMFDNFEHRGEVFMALVKQLEFE